MAPTVLSAPHEAYPEEFQGGPPAAALLMFGKRGVSLGYQPIENRLRDAHKVTTKEALMLRSCPESFQVEIGHAVSAVRASRSRRQFYLCELCHGV